MGFVRLDESHALGGICSVTPCQSFELGKLTRTGARSSFPDRHSSLPLLSPAFAMFDRITFYSVILLKPNQILNLFSPKLFLNLSRLAVRTGNIDMRKGRIRSCTMPMLFPGRE